MSGSAAEWMDTVLWCITPGAYEAMRSIAERDPLPEEEIAQAMHGPKALALRQGKRREGGGHMVMQGDVALIYVDGPIYRYADYFTKVSGGVTTEALARDYNAAFDDTGIIGIVSVFDSPGGEGAGINELSDTIRRMRGRKPLIAYVESQAASAAYWIATAHDEIVTDETALLGSIGTIVSVPDPAKRFRRSIDFVSATSPRKRPDPTTDAGRADIQALADALNEVFIEKVALNMGVTPETVLRDFGQGAQVTGRQAVALGMAHRLGSEERLIQELHTRTTRGRALPIRQPATVPTFAMEESMKVSQFIAGIFTGAKDAGIELEPDVAPAQAETRTTAILEAVAAPLHLAAATEPSPEQTAQAAELADLRRQLATQRQAQIAQAATTFADTAVRDRRAFPAEHAALIALYTQAAQDDGARPSGEGQQTRVAQVEAMIAARPQHSLSSEIIASGAGGVLETTDASTPMSAERRQKLLSMTPLGQAVLRGEKTKSA